MQEIENGPFGLPGQLASEIINEGERYLPIIADYNAAMHLGHMAAYREALKYAYGRSVLEIGCGVGYGSFFLASYGAKHVTALDLGFTALRYARDVYRHPNLDHLQANGQELPFADQSFDFVFSTQVIEHVPSVEQFLSEVRRVLKPSGSCLIITPNQTLFSPDDQNTNPHHISEMDVETFRCQMQKVFPHVRMRGTPQNCLKWDAAARQMGVRSNSEVSIYDFANQDDNLEACENLLGYGRFSVDEETEVNLPMQLRSVTEELAPFFWDATAQSWSMMGIYPVDYPQYSIVFGWLPKRLLQAFISPRNGLHRIQIGTYAAFPCPMTVKLLAGSNPENCIARAVIRPGKRSFDWAFPVQVDSRGKQYNLVLEAGTNLSGYMRLRPSVRFAALPPDTQVKNCTSNGVEQPVRLALRTFHIDLPPVEAAEIPKHARKYRESTVLMFGQKKSWLWLLLILALLRGALYAFTMPAWGLLDEEQHFDYILKVAETGRPPVTGKDLIDLRIAQSVINTHRAERFHWPAPASTDPKDMGLERYSYEGYQGPLFYYLSAPFYLLIPGSLLDKLFALRLLMVLLSLITVWAAVRTAAELFPEYEYLPFWVGALIICIPERTGSTGRLTNDILLEIISMLFIWVFVRAVLHGISWKSAVGLGALAGLGILTKISFIGLLVLLPIVFLIQRKQKGIVAKGTLAILITGVIGLPFLFYLYKLYGDPTGFQGFADLYNRFGSLWNPPLNLITFISAVGKIFAGFWVVWWNGADAQFPAGLKVIWGLLFFICLIASGGAARFTSRQYRENRPRFWVLISFALIIIIIVALTGAGYYQGKFPVIQGRFLLPVLFPIALILCLGLHELSPLRVIFWPMCAALLILDAALLFGNPLPYHYYFSAFYQNGQPLPYSWHGWNWAASTFFSNYLSSKPAWVIAGTLVSLPGYLMLLAALLVRQRFICKSGYSPLKNQEVEG